jgi:cysteine desulfurase
MDGGGHERGMRSGTLNVPGIVGFGKACEICKKEMQQDAQRLSALRNKLEAALVSLEDVFINGNKDHRLPQVTNLSFKNVEGEGLLMSLNKEIALSSGSACTSASIEPSYVLKALGLPDDLAHSSLRFGLGRFTTEEEIDYIIERVSKEVQKLRALYKESVGIA